MRAGDRQDVTASLVHVHELFGGATGEASLVTADRRRMVQTVNGRVVTTTAALVRGPLRAALATAGSARTAPYRSPATGRWVIGYVARVEGGGVVLLELTLQAVGWVLAEDRRGADLRIVDRRTGAVVVDAREQGDGGRPQGRLDPRFASLRATRSAVGVVSGSEQTLAYRRLPVAGEHNDWLLVDVARRLPAECLRGPDGSLYCWPWSAASCWPCRWAGCRHPGDSSSAWRRSTA